MTGGSILDGRAEARRLRAEVRARLARHRARNARLPVPTLGLVAADVHPGTRRFVALKERAFHEAGLAVAARVLPAEADTGAVLEAVVDHARDAGVHGLFLQYPLPREVDARRCFDAIPVAMDVDGSSGEARRLLAEGREIYAPATPLAVVRLLERAGARHTNEGAADGPGGGPAITTVTLVAGDPGVAEPLAVLLGRRGVGVRMVDRDDPHLGRVVGGAGVLVTCAGRAGAVDGRWVPDGSVVVDAGYHHRGGRGDLDPEPDPGRLAAYVPARGGVGPLTVALLAAHTLDACLRQVDDAS